MVLAASELVTNALVQRSGFIVTVSSRDRTVRLEVQDADPNGPQPEAGADPGGSTGRGLRIVDALAHR